MAEHRVSAAGWQFKPDSTGSVFFEPYSVKASNDRWDYMVGVFEEHDSNVSAQGKRDIPQNISSGGTFDIEWTASKAGGNVVWGVAYRVVGDSESFDQTGDQSAFSSSEVSAPSSADNRITTSIGLTSSELTAGSALQWELSRQTADSALTGPVTLHGAYLRYDDA